ncbi:hypothetical protein PSTT_08056 [Puccinia striiformis]|uniref:Uncharacterized protein n=1 Tax=Puccinia striiformis TaxID=27350 RepID=A0A2S4VDS6_9BASI|nr:hypothetical protein PSTT_08056 [Puccinia striiformis]
MLHQMRGGWIPHTQPHVSSQTVHDFIEMSGVEPVFCTSHHPQMSPDPSLLDHLGFKFPSRKHQKGHCFSKKKKTKHTASKKPSSLESHSNPPTIGQEDFLPTPTVEDHNCSFLPLSGFVDDLCCFCDETLPKNPLAQTRSSELSQRLELETSLKTPQCCICLLVYMTLSIQLVVVHFLKEPGTVDYTKQSLPPYLMELIEAGHRLTLGNSPGDFSTSIPSASGRT